MPRTFVIDACIALDAGSKDPPGERAARVRGFLLAVLNASHRIAFTVELENEWKRHAARFARRWLRAMHSRRLFDRVCPKPNQALKRRVLNAAPNEGVRDALDKDWHLILAVLLSDHIIASSDDKARRYYADVACCVAALKTIAWVNPATLDIARWVEDGARKTDNVRLG